MEKDIPMDRRKILMFTTVALSSMLLGSCGGSTSSTTPVDLNVPIATAATTAATVMASASGATPPTIQISSADTPLPSITEKAPVPSPIMGYNGAYENGITPTNTPTLNAANLNGLLLSMSKSGGGMIWFNQAGNYQIDDTIVLRSNVGIRMVPGAQFYWSGEPIKNIFTTDKNEVVINGDYQINLHEGYNFSGISYNMHSHLYCRMDCLSLGISPNHQFVRLGADSVAGQQYPVYSLNSAFNTYSFRHMGQCGIGLQIVGKDLGPGQSGQVVTNSTFTHIQFANCRDRAIRIDRWADTLTFVGNSYAAITGKDGVGLWINEVNSLEPSVYNVRFDQLSIDTFEGPLNRTGIVLGNSKLIYIDAWFQNPVAERGMFIDNGCTSYAIRGKDAATDQIHTISKGII